MSYNKKVSIAEDSWRTCMQWLQRNTVTTMRNQDHMQGLGGRTWEDWERRKNTPLSTAAIFWTKKREEKDQQALGFRWESSNNKKLTKINTHISSVILNVTYPYSPRKGHILGKWI